MHAVALKETSGQVSLAGLLQEFLLPTCVASAVSIVDCASRLL